MPESQSYNRWELGGNTEQSNPEEEIKKKVVEQEEALQNLVSQTRSFLKSESPTYDEVTVFLKSHLKADNYPYEAFTFHSCRIEISGTFVSFIEKQIETTIPIANIFYYVGKEEEQNNNSQG